MEPRVEKKTGSENLRNWGSASAELKLEMGLKFNLTATSSLTPFLQIDKICKTQCQAYIRSSTETNFPTSLPPFYLLQQLGQLESSSLTDCYYNLQIDFG